MIIKRHYTFISIAIVSAICTVMVLFYLYSIHRISDIYTERSQQTIFNIKKEFLERTVNNLFTEIDLRRAEKSKRFQMLTSQKADRINMQTGLSDDSFKAFLLSEFTENTGDNAFAVLVWDVTANRAFFDPHNLAQSSWEATFSAASPSFSTYRVITHGGVKVLFGVLSDNIDAEVKADIADTIRSMVFDHGSYIWVNEVVDYRGGENYAIRRIHPYLPETEGRYLSTETADIKGNLPYLTELEGVKKDGELFFTYYFKEPGKDRVSEKLTYAKLYKDFDWIIAMGIYIKDLEAYSEQTNQESNRLVSRLTIILVLLFVAIMTISYFMIIFIQKLYYRHSRKQLESEMSLDPLTGALNRRSGTVDLTRAFDIYSHSGRNPGIMMFDVDNFKDINDNYGHSAGDKVLTEIIAAIRDTVRSSDRIIRWGGDEFVILLYGMQKRHAHAYGDSILKAVSSLKIPIDENVYSPTISIGFTFFQAGDADYTDALLRADQAMYVSKSNGRNCSTLSI